MSTKTIIECDHCKKQGEGSPFVSIIGGHSIESGVFNLWVKGRSVGQTSRLDFCSPRCLNQHITDLAE